MQDYRGEPGPLLDAINFASEIQRLLLSVADPNTLWQRRNDRQLEPNSDIEAEAARWRGNIGLSAEAQLAAKSHDSFFLLFRSLIEAQGISVIVSSYEESRFKGLVLGSTLAVPVILINSFRQLKSSRTFTLAHEFCHVLLEDDGVSNPYEASSKIEQICNRFAAALLMPRDMVVSLLNTRSSATSNATIKWLSNKLKVSMEAVVIRLVECGFAERNFWAVWKSQFGRWLPSEEKPKGGGSSEDGVDQGWVKLAKFGFLFGRVVPERFKERGLTGMAIFNASRLKPAYLPELARATGLTP
jgi:Zn-dependent peptidase ImmA (M78 family)